jgi:hypothetical protein
VAEEATIEGPPRRRTSWSLKTIVEDVAGRPIGELQDPTRPVHPYLRGKVGELPSAPSPAADEPPYDPVDHLYPPLIGPQGREYHGPEHEHHQETLDRHRPLTGPTGEPLRPPGPSHRPERLYLHYLLLHMDRLSNSALHYLQRAVEEEVTHREQPPTASAPTSPVREAVPETPPSP